MNDILKRDQALAGYFVHEDLARKWITIVSQKIAPWIYSKNQKGLWLHVFEVSKALGYIKANAKRTTFAKMVYTFCREVLKEDETANKIKSSMASYSCYGCKNDIPNAKEAVESFFDGASEDKIQEATQPTLLFRLEEYMRKTIKEETHIFPCSRVFVNKDYGNDIRPNLSIEKYQNEAFLDKGTPSSIEAYLCIDNELSIEKLKSLMFTYGKRKNIKLYVVSNHSLRPDVYKLAKDEGVGYVLINLKREMTRSDYVLPRSIGDSYARRSYTDMLFGNVEMDCPLLIFDGQQVTSSLADSLRLRDIAVNPAHELKAPVIKFDDIERKADSLTEIIVEERIAQLRELVMTRGNRLYVNVPLLTERYQDGRHYVERIREKQWLDYSVDPFSLAQADGVSYTFGLLPDHQLGRIDLLTGRIILSEDNSQNYGRTRFTMAHEYGHYRLHALLLKSQGIRSFGDTDDSLSELVTIRGADRQWLERQANHFASCLLMPSKLVWLLYIILHKEFVEDVYGDKFGPVFYNEKQPETYDAYNNVVGGMAKLLDVSKTAMSLRLEGMNLIKK